MRSIREDLHRTLSHSAFDRLREDLGIRGKQEAAWESLVAQMELCDGLLSRRGTVLGGPGLASSLDAEFETLSARLEAIAVLRPALATLYAVLSPRQRIRADRLLRGHCGVVAPDHRSARAAIAGTLPKANLSRRKGRSEGIAA